MTTTSPHHILHADLDAFYASVEQLDNPELRGKPVLVGGRPEDRGVVATASYEARRYGVHSAMPMRVAIRLCPQATVVRPRFDRYRKLSDLVMAAFRQLTDLVEPMSLDEAYLDITPAVDRGADPKTLALELKAQVRSETGLTLSVGVASSKSVAKIASDLNKPDGLVLVAAGEEASFLAHLPVSKLPGIGPKTVERLRLDGIETIGQMAQQTSEWFQRRFGKRGGGIRARSLGQDQEPVHTRRETKSVSSETTFAIDVNNQDRLHEELARLTKRLVGHLEAKDLQGRTVTLKLRLSDFTTFTRQTTLPTATRSEGTIMELAWRLLSNEMTPGRSFRLLGVGVSGFGTASQLELPLFSSTPLFSNIEES